MELSYSIWIQATAAQVWQALTDPRMTVKYFPYHAVRSDWRVGSDYAMSSSDGSVAYEGKVLAAEPNRLLVQSVDFKIPGLAGHQELTLEWVLEEVGDACKLTTRHRGSDSDRKLLETLVSHCPDTSSGIKTLLETGKPLRMGQPVPAGR